MNAILTINAGSSSLKYAAFDGKLKPLLSGLVEGYGREALAKAVVAFSAHGIQLAEVSGIGHRVVHGGTRFVAPTRVDDTVQAELESLRRLAPLHLPYGLGAMAEMRRLAPHVPHIACFDTAFHAGRDDLHTRLPLPRAYDERGYRRYGFHGLNYEHVVSALPGEIGAPLPRRLLIAHLGSGCSMCAVLDGRSVETTMGYSTADGLVMATRTGAIDPGVLVALLRDENLSLEALEDLLYRKSGLLGLSGETSDMRKLLASDRPQAREAVDIFCYQAARHAASLAASIGGLDMIVFTGGIGENSPEVRRRIMAHLEFLKIPAVHVVKADEEMTIARHVKGTLAAPL